MRPLGAFRVHPSEPARTEGGSRRASARAPSRFARAWRPDKELKEIKPTPNLCYPSYSKVGTSSITVQREGSSRWIHWRAKSLTRAERRGETGVGLASGVFVAPRVACSPGTPAGCAGATCLLSVPRLKCVFAELGPPPALSVLMAQLHLQSVCPAHSCPKDTLISLEDPLSSALSPRGPGDTGSRDSHRTRQTPSPESEPRGSAHG